MIPAFKRMPYLILLVVLVLCTGTALSEQVPNTEWKVLPTPGTILSTELMFVAQGDALYLHASTFKYKPRPKPKPKLWRERRRGSYKEKKPEYIDIGDQIYKLKGGRWKNVGVPGSPKAFKRLFLFQGSVHALGDALYRYDGANWTKVGPAFKGGLFDIAVSDQRIYIAHFEYQHLHVSTLVGGKWVKVGGPVARAAEGASIAVFQGDCYATRHRRNGSISLHRYHKGRWTKLAELSKRITKVNAKIGAPVHSNLLAHAGKLSAILLTKDGVKIVRDVLSKPSEGKLMGHGWSHLDAVAGPDGAFYSYFTNHIHRNKRVSHMLKLARSSPQGTKPWGGVLTRNLSVPLGRRISSVGIARSGNSLFVAYLEKHKDSSFGTLKLLKRTLK